MMGHAFASRGYLVFNINYHLAPKHPYPTALLDVAKAVRWVRSSVVSNAEYFVSIGPWQLIKVELNDVLKCRGFRKRSHKVIDLLELGIA